MNHPVIRCKNMTLGYGRETVLEKVSLDIPAGILLPFLGPNGAGKTTLLRAILGLIKPLSGSLERRVRAGYVPQFKTFDPLFPLTVREIVEMGFYPELGWWKKPGKVERAMTSAILEELHLAEHAHKNYRELSGGMKQKTLLARAWASRAEILVLDEPTSELDAASENEVFRHLIRLVEREGRTVLMAHHSLHLLEKSAAKKAVFVDHGKIRLGGIPDGSQEPFYG